MSSLAVLGWSLSSVIGALPWGWTFVDMIKWVVVVAAIIAIAIIAMRAFKVTPPEWAVQMFWVVIVAVCAIFCIYLIASL